MMESSVVFPLPDGPTTMRTSPAFTSRSTPAGACAAASGGTDKNEQQNGCLFNQPALICNLEVA